MKGCPQYILLSNDKPTQYKSKIMDVIINDFGITLDENLKQKYLNNISNNHLCVRCIQKLEITEVQIKDIDKSKISRKLLKQLKQKYKRDRILPFYQCSKCQFLSYMLSDDILDQLYMRLLYRFEPKRERPKKIKKEINDAFERIPCDKEIFPALNALTLSHRFKLKSVYQSVYDEEPDTSNHRKQFSGCLDYIFVSNSTKVIHTNKLPNRDKLDFLPNVNHGSDHLHIKTIISCARN